MALDPRLADPRLLMLAALRLKQRQTRPADPWLAGMTDAWMREVFTLADQHGHLDAICTETLHLCPAGVRAWLAAEG